MALSNETVGMDDAIELLSSPVTLPSGVIVSNRLVKAAMEEGIGQGGGIPGIAHRRLYKRWSDGDWGIIISGNVQIDARNLATGHDRTFPSKSPKAIEAWSQIASIITESPRPALAIIQISHAGLQSSSTINFSRPPWSPAVAPIPARPDLGNSFLGWIMSRAIWPVKSRAVKDVEEWLKIVDRFIEVAKDAEQAGWDGVQIHSAHGYLLAEYLSPLTNPDPSPLPGVPERIPLRLHILYLILIGLCQSTNSTFVKSVKFNSSDFVQGGFDEEQSAQAIKEIVSWKLIDILEISGGVYANPTFASLESITQTTLTRQSLFSHFTANLLPSLPPPPTGPAILLTGGLHSRALIHDCLQSRACDLVGIGRPACINPTLPRDVILNKEIPTKKATIGGYTIPGGERMKRLLGGGGTLSPTTNAPTAATYMDAEDGMEDTPLLPRDKVKPHGLPIVGAGISTFWHEWQLCRMGRGVEPDLHMDWLWGGLIVEGIWWGMMGGGRFGWGRK